MAVTPRGYCSWLLLLRASRIVWSPHILPRRNALLLRLNGDPVHRGTSAVFVLTHATSNCEQYRVERTNVRRQTVKVATIDYYFKFCVNHGCPSQTSSSSSVSPSSSSSPSPTNSATTSPGTFSTSATASPVPSSSSPVNAGARALSQGAIIGIAFGGFGAMTIILLIAIFFILFRQREGRRCRQPPTTRPEKRMTSSRPSKRAAPPQPLSPTYTHFAGSPMRMRATSLSSPSALITPLPSPVLPSVPPRSPHRDVQLSFPTPPAATTTAQPPPWPFRHSSVQSRIQDGQYRSIHEIDGRSLRNQNDIWTDDLIDEGDSLWRGYEDHYFHHEHDDEDGDGAGTFLRRSSISSSAVLEGRTMV
ncbi:hypothetical protein GJ744_002692 [Endocarpon pusillum]|uniref:Uncharacterized protein n=1 Tax=Endocarpon pusillum TaxID=364733 RepID=A0A8H7APJ8_9EURO|nr:hypothetical protein GJ744_002692 [Endocarpon pusillum]